MREIRLFFDTNVLVYARANSKRNTSSDRSLVKCAKKSERHSIKGDRLNGWKKASGLFLGVRKRIAPTDFSKGRSPEWAKTGSDLFVGGIRESPMPYPTYFLTIDERSLIRPCYS